jgi:uncharacterized protein YjiS (DUF1127 family)
MPMTLIHHSVLGTSRTSGPTLLTRIAAAVAREFRIRRDMRLLSQFGDSALHDIGLSRGGVEDAVRYGRSAFGRSSIVGPAPGETSEPVALPSADTEWR